MRRLSLLISLSLSACAVDFTDEPETSTSEHELGPTVYLRAYWSAANGDNALSTNESFSTSNPGYTHYRNDGIIFSPDAPQPPDTMALWTWYGSARGDYLTTTNSYWANGTPGELRNNYTFVRKEGYVFTHAVAGTQPLQQWWNATRADNFTTSDPRYTVDTAQLRGGYDYVRAEGYVLPTPLENSPAKKENFDYAELGHPVGERDLLVLLVDWHDAPMRHTRAQFEDLAFGPSFPNVRDYTLRTSQGDFTWRRGAVLGPYRYPNDPATHADESSFFDSWKLPGTPTTETIAFSYFEAQDGRFLQNIGDTVTTAGDARRHLVVFGFADLNGGTLENGDAIALKASNGKWIRESGTTLVADGTSTTGSARFVIRSAVAATITSEAIVTLQAASGRYIKAEGTTVSTTPLEWGCAFTLRKAFGPDANRQVRAGLAAAAANGYDFRVHDKDGDNVVEPSELSIVVIHSAPFWDGGATRGFDAMTLPVGFLSTIQIAGRDVSSMGEDTSFMTVVHELHHHLGTYDLYGHGAGDNNLTTMAATIYSNLEITPPYLVPDNRDTWLLDPWHRVHLGWVEPEIHALNIAGGSDRVTSPAFNSGRPLLLYDPRRYDTSTKLGEYFFVEFRNAALDYTYDANAATSSRPTGVAIWRITEVEDNKALIVTLASDGTVGGSRLWTAADGTIALSYTDGSDALFRIRIGATTATSTAASIEWTTDGVLRPRIDSASASAAPGATISVSGMMPVSGASMTARFFNTYTGVWTPSQTITYGTPIRLTVPTTPSTYRLHLYNGSEQSNGHMITVD